MTDRLGYRMKAAVLAPSTNTIVEPEYYMMAPHGVTFHIGRIFIRDQVISDDNRFENLLVQIRQYIDDAIDSVMTCEPDCIIMGMSAETFWGGKEGNLALQKRIGEKTGLRVYTGADACNKALDAYGVKRIACISPYQNIGDEAVKRFFEDWGHEVVRIKGLKCPTAVSIAHVTEDELRNAILEVNGPDVEAIVQVGTNLCMARLAAEAERWLGKPVIAINTATVWYAMRQQGIQDKIQGFGRLLSDF